MWVVVAILILVTCPCDGTNTSETISVINTESPVREAPASTLTNRIFPRRVIDDAVTYNVGDTSYVSLWDKLLYPLPNTESTEEQQGYNTYYNGPSTVNFHDIYSNSLALLAEDPIIATAKDEEVTLSSIKDRIKDVKSLHLNNIDRNFVEFHPKTPTTMTPVTLPPSKFVLNSTYINMMNSTTSTSTTTTEEPEELGIEVIPIKKKNDIQRGLLDLLFPAARVRTFKTVFDTFRRIMSHTFR